MKKIAILTILVLFLGIEAVACTCGGEPFTTPLSPGEGEGESTTPESRPDLVVSTIEVLPAQPQPGQPFSLNVYVANQGQASSGEYDVAINIQDISHGGSYPIGTFRQGAMNPGESYCVYSSTNVLVNDPGSYQVNVEIIPFLFDDGNTGNNSVSKPFTAQVVVGTPLVVLPVIHFFTVAPSSIPPDGSVTLSWEVSWADQVYLSSVLVVRQSTGGAVIGTREPVEVPAVGTWVDSFGAADIFSPGDTYTYTLTAISSAGTVDETVTISFIP